MHRSTPGTIALVAALTLGLAACSGDGGRSPGAANAKADVAAAKAGIEPFLEPSGFPVTEPLAKLPTGSRLAIIDCGSPICGLFADLAAAPAKELGMTTTRIKAGTTADGVASAFDTVLADDYDGVFVPAIDPALWAKPLDELNAAGIPVATSGIIGLDPSKVVAAGAAEPSQRSSGVLMADWVTEQTGDDTNAVFYTTPELSFSATINEGFLAEMKKVCDGCTVRTVEIPVAQFGSGAPQIVVDDLLAHPDTTVAAFAVGEQTIGLPSALKAADLQVTTLLNSPDPSVLQGIKDGDYTAGVGVDLPVLTWSMIDSLARGITKQDIGQPIKDDELVRQILTADNLPADVSKGWTGYPDFAQRFAALWKDAK
jgi:ribose transport system substrate-binding protein